MYQPSVAACKVKAGHHMAAACIMQLLLCV